MIYLATIPLSASSSDILPNIEPSQRCFDDLCRLQNGTKYSSLDISGFVMEYVFPPALSSMLNLPSASPNVLSINF